MRRNYKILHRPFTFTPRAQPPFPQIMVNVGDNETRVWVKRSLFSESTPAGRKVVRAASNDELDSGVISHVSSVEKKSLVRSHSGDEMIFPSRGRRTSNNRPVGNLSAQSEDYEWALGWMTENESDMTVSIRLDAGENNKGLVTATTITVSREQIGTEILVANPTPSAPHDLVTLDHFHEPTVVECLKRRFAEGHIYTNTGPVLIALNPFQPLADLYGDDVMRMYWNHAEQQALDHDDLLPPHVYAIADNSFRNMMRGLQMSVSKASKKNTNQSILVSGESGAGKTVTTKYIMKYLAALSQRAHQSASGRARAYLNIQSKTESSLLNKSTSNSNLTDLSSSLSIEAQVLQSNPILESFGNARTVRNDNSSRFGKFIQMQFSETGRLLGTAIETYLLEKVRVVHQSEGERNYHIFYELLSPSVSEEESTRLQTLQRKPSDFKMLASGTYARRDGVKDSETYQDLQKAMKMIGFSTEEISDIMAVTAAIMHASNTVFDPKVDEGCSVARSNLHLTATCLLLGVTVDDFEEALCFFSRTARGQVYRSPQSVERAEKGLGALLKATYGALFEFLVQRINTSICGQGNCHSSVIGVLDIFGFESFQTNSFEQLCINYCNEVLQQQFNTFMLKNEQAEYISEGIDWDFIKFPENQDVLDLIEHKTDGIMSILDDMCKAPGASDKAFVSEVIKRCEKQSCFNANFKDTSPLFSVKHFAGSVEYTTDGFLEKNRNELPKETSELLKSSSNTFVHALADIILDSSPNGNTETAKSRTVKTVGGFFRQQVKDLRQKIEATYPHYVRCIKPNAALVHSEYDSAMVAQQLRCGGILQAVSVTRDGFTLHYSHYDFLQRYQVLVDEKSDKTTKAPKLAVEADCKKLVDILLERIEEEEQCHSNKANTDASADQEIVIDKTESTHHDDEEVLIQFGKTKVLLKHHAFLSLERQLGAIQNKNATILNTAFRRYFCQTAFQCVRAAFRAELASRGTTFEEWFEHRAIYYRPRQKGTFRIPNLVRHRMKMFNAAASGSSKPKERIANDSKKIDLKNQVWILQNNGLFQRNPDYVGDAL